MEGGIKDASRMEGCIKDGRMHEGMECANRSAAEAPRRSRAHGHGAAEAPSHPKLVTTPHSAAPTLLQCTSCCGSMRLAASHRPLPQSPSISY